MELLICNICSDGYILDFDDICSTCDATVANCKVCDIDFDDDFNYIFPCEGCHTGYLVNGKNLEFFQNFRFFINV